MHKLLMDLPDTMETDRMFIRSYRPGDGEMYFAVGMRNRSHLLRFEGMNSVLKPTNVEEAEVVIREFVLEWAARNAFFLGGFHKESGEFIVQIYIGAVNWETREFELGYFVDCLHEGQGFVTEAGRAALDFLFNNLDARRVRLECSDLNLRSQRVAEKLGFSLEAHFREDKLDEDGSYSGTLVYGLLRSERGQES